MKIVTFNLILCLCTGSCLRIVLGHGDGDDFRTSSITSFACPAGFIRVPANSAVGTTSDFCVAKYEMKDNGFGEAVSVAAGAPWIGIDSDDAKTECDDLNTINGVSNKYALITNPEWMTIARNVEVQDINWLSGTAGVGMIARGHSDNFPPNGLAASADDSDGYINTVSAVTDPIGGGREQRRTLTLSNGEVIWDFAGSLNEWVDWDIPAASKAFVLADGPVFVYQDLNELDVNVGPLDVMKPSAYLPFFSTLDRTNGLGAYWNPGGGDAVGLRGGAYNYAAESGIYALDVNYLIAGHLPGFRCVYHP